MNHQIAQLLFNRSNIAPVGPHRLLLCSLLLSRLHIIGLLFSKLRTIGLLLSRLPSGFGIHPHAIFDSIPQERDFFIQLTGSKKIDQRAGVGRHHRHRGDTLDPLLGAERLHKQRAIFERYLNLQLTSHFYGISVATDVQRLSNYECSDNFFQWRRPSGSDGSNFLHCLGSGAFNQIHVGGGRR